MTELRRFNLHFSSCNWEWQDSLTRVHAKSWDGSLSEVYDSKSCGQMIHSTNLVLGPLYIIVATPPPHITNVQERFWPLRFPMFYYRKGGGWRPGWRPQFIGVPGLIFFPWIICKHDFKPNPSDRELFYDIPTNWPFYVNSLFHSFFVVYSLSLVSVPAPKLQIYITFHDYFFYYTPYCF